MSNPKTYLVVILRAENVTMGYVLDAYPEERAAYIAELRQENEQIIGEFAALLDAQAALALAMVPAGGHA